MDIQVQQSQLEAMLTVFHLLVEQRFSVGAIAIQVTILSLRVLLGKL